MPKYIVTCRTVWHEEYLVEAKSAEEAKENFSAIDAEELSNDYQYFDGIEGVVETDEYDD